MNKNHSVEIQAVEIKIDKHVRIRASDANDSLKHALRECLNFINPKWLENEKRGYWNGNTPKDLKFLEEKKNELLMPRGFVKQLAIILERNSLNYTLKDNTRVLPEVSFDFKGNLYNFQKRAVNSILSRRFGVFNCPTGGGKTVVALYCIAERKQPALVIVHTKELLYQWQNRAEAFLGLSPDEIGLIGDGHNEIGSKITIAIVNSLYKHADDMRDRIGYLIVDECHRAPSRTFIEAVSAFDCRYMLGLSATPYRRDKLTRVIYFYMGDGVCDIEPHELQLQQKIMRARLEVRATGFDYNYSGSEDYQPMLNALADDEKRNTQIADDVLAHIQNDNGIALVISDRKEHCRNICAYIEERKLSVRLLTGDVPNGQRKIIVEELNEGMVRVLVATAQLIGEGFDLKKLSALFLCTPVKFTGRIKQYVGRILRMDEDKEEAVIYDYVDRPGVLKASFKSRLWAYKELGIRDIKGIGSLDQFMWDGFQNEKK